MYMIYIYILYIVIYIIVKERQVGINKIKAFCKSLIVRRHETYVTV